MRRSWAPSCWSVASGCWRWCCWSGRPSRSACAGGDGTWRWSRWPAATPPSCGASCSPTAWCWALLGAAAGLLLGVGAAFAGRPLVEQYVFGARFGGYRCLAGRAGPARRGRRTGRGARRAGSGLDGRPAGRGRGAGRAAHPAPAPDAGGWPLGLALVAGGAGAGRVRRHPDLVDRDPDRPDPRANWAWSAAPPRWSACSPGSAGRCRWRRGSRYATPAATGPAAAPAISRRDGGGGQQRRARRLPGQRRCPQRARLPAEHAARSRCWCTRSDPADRPDPTLEQVTRAAREQLGAAAVAPVRAAMCAPQPRPHRLLLHRPRAAPGADLPVAARGRPVRRRSAGRPGPTRAAWSPGWTTTARTCTRRWTTAARCRSSPAPTRRRPAAATRRAARRRCGGDRPALPERRPGDRGGDPWGGRRQPPGQRHGDAARVRAARGGRPASAAAVRAGGSAARPALDRFQLGGERAEPARPAAAGALHRRARALRRVLALGGARRRVTKRVADAASARRRGRADHRGRGRGRHRRSPPPRAAPTWPPSRRSAPPRRYAGCCRSARPGSSPGSARCWASSAGLGTAAIVLASVNRRVRHRLAARDPVPGRHAVGDARRAGAWCRWWRCSARACSPAPGCRSSGGWTDRVRPWRRTGPDRGCRPGSAAGRLVPVSVLGTLTRRVGHHSWFGAAARLLVPADRVVGRLTRGRVVALGLIPSLVSPPPAAAPASHAATPCSTCPTATRTW